MRSARRRGVGGRSGSATTAEALRAAVASTRPARGSSGLGSNQSESKSRPATRVSVPLGLVLPVIPQRERAPRRVLAVVGRAGTDQVRRPAPAPRLRRDQPVQLVQIGSLEVAGNRVDGTPIGARDIPGPPYGPERQANREDALGGLDIASAIGTSRSGASPFQHICPEANRTTAPRRSGSVSALLRRAPGVRRNRVSASLRCPAASTAELMPGERDKGRDDRAGRRADVSRAAHPARAYIARYPEWTRLQGSP